MLVGSPVLDSYLECAPEPRPQIASELDRALTPSLVRALRQMETKSIIVNVKPNPEDKHEPFGRIGARESSDQSGHQLIN